MEWNALGRLPPLDIGNVSLPADPDVNAQRSVTNPFPDQQGGEPIVILGSLGTIFHVMS